MTSPLSSLRGAHETDPLHIDVFAFDLDDPNHDFDIETLSSDEQERAQRFRFDRDRVRYQRGRATLRARVSECIKVAPDAIRFDYGAQGKPRIAKSALHFNLAHSESLAVLAISYRELGIDIEAHRTGFAEDQIAERFFAPIEVQQLRALPIAQQSAAFFRCWTRKEAFIKALGGGLSIPLDDFTVAFADNDRPRITWVRDAPDEHDAWTIIDCSCKIAKPATIAIAIRGPVSTVNFSLR